MNPIFQKNQARHGHHPKSGAICFVELGRTVLIVLVLLTLIASEVSSADPIPIRKLFGVEHAEAVNARQHADLMWANLEDRLRVKLRESRQSNNRIPSLNKIEYPSINAEALEVFAAYQQVINRFPHTEIGMDCALRMAGVYQFFGDANQAIKIVEQTAAEYSGTEEGIKAIFEAGINHAQVQLDPVESIKWLSLIPKPVDDKYDVNAKLYLAAQQMMARCELHLKLDSSALKRVEGLMQIFPQYANEIERSYQFELQSQAGQGNTITPSRERTNIDLHLREYPGISIRTQSSVQPGVSPSSLEKNELHPSVVQASQLLESSVIRLRGRLEPGDETDSLISSLASQKEDAVAEIGRQLANEQSDSTFSTLKYRSASVLGKINSERSRAMLRAMIIEGLGGDSNKAWAASRLLECDKSEAWNLLRSNDPQVLQIALNVADGQSIDALRLELLTPLLNNDNYRIHGQAAVVIAHGTTGDLALKALDQIGAGLETVKNATGLDTVTGGRGGSIVSTLGQDYYRSYLNALVALKVENDILHQFATRQEGRAKEIVYMAIAERGDSFAHGEIVRIATDPDAGPYRAWAVRALGKIGTPSDLPVLHQIAANDPYNVQGSGAGARRSTRPGGIVYPVREAAEQSIRMIGKRFAP